MKYYTLLNTPYFVYWLGILVFGIATEPMPSFDAYLMIFSWFLFSSIIFFALANMLLDYIFYRKSSKRVFLLKTCIQSVILVIQSYLVLSYGYLNHSSVYHRDFMFDLAFTSVLTIICFMIIHSIKTYISYVQIKK